MWICVKEKKTDATESQSRLRDSSDKSTFWGFQKALGAAHENGLSFISSGECALEQSRAATASHLKCGSRRGKALAEPRLQIRSFVFPFPAFSRAYSE